jgi:beta-phosphoglucomutase-like phosphatase (HAD superfamily)
MKPDSGMVLDAVRAVGGHPAACVLVGDSMSDIVAARAAGVRIVAYANRPSKVVPFAVADVSPVRSEPTKAAGTERDRLPLAPPS